MHSALLDHLSFRVGINDDNGRTHNVVHARASAYISNPYTRYGCVGYRLHIGSGIVYPVVYQRGMDCMRNKLIYQNSYAKNIKIE